MELIAMPSSPKSSKPKPTRAKKISTRRLPPARPAAPSAKPIASYDHKLAERVNNPPVGLVHADNDPDLAVGRKQYAYDPHLDPQLVWAGKAEHTSFTVPTVSLHVHERIDPRTIVEAVRRKGTNAIQYEQLSLFHSARENPPMREAIEFYKHRHNWSNRLIAGDSLLVMNSLLEKEGMAGQVQMVYIDPPYGIKYSSNFQPFVNKRDVRDGKDDDLTQEPEMVKAFRDTWELGIHSYLAYLRDRLKLAKELLTESGSVFVQISDENVHLVRNLLDEIFGAENFSALITFRKKLMPLGSDVAESVSDYVLWYCKDRDKIKSRPIFKAKEPEGDSAWGYVDLLDGQRRRLTSEEVSDHNLIPKGAKLFQSVSLLPAQYRPNQDFDFEYEGIKYSPPKGSCWKTDRKGMEQIAKQKRLLPSGKTLRYVLYHDDYPVSRITNLWADTAGADDPVYVVQTNTKVIQRCMLMATDPGDIVLDPTCGSGTTAFVAEQWGRRWITCDTSRVSITLAKQRLMTALFDYYDLARPDEGVDSGFRYKTVPHITLKSIANNEPADQETLYDQPFVDNARARVTGPFTVEAVPAPSVAPLAPVVSPEAIEKEMANADASIARSGETLRQAQWRDELLRTGIRGKGGQKIEFTRIEPLLGTRYLHADAETRPTPVTSNAVRGLASANGEISRSARNDNDKPMRVVVSFSSAYAPLEQRQVERAIEEAHDLVPKPKLVVFAAFQFDPEAAKDIEETKWPGMTLLKVQMNTDLLTDDLKKNRTSNESFWLIGQPDVTLDTIKTGADKGKYRVTVQGFDYYNTKTGNIESGSVAQIAMWLLDPDYDGRSLFPRQVFFPLAGDKEGWAKLARNLKAEIDEDLIEAYRGTESLPFDLGKNKRVAVKIIDDRGIESLKVIEV
jgi:adenine-specific DNA-methyltransferase